MGLRDWLANKIKGDKDFGGSLMFEPGTDDSDPRLKGFSPVTIDGLIKRFNMRKDSRITTFSEMLDWLEEHDQTWVLLKNDKMIARYDTFPDFDAIMDDHYDKYGGGTYVIKCLVPKPVRVGSYKVEGEDKMEEAMEKEANKGKKKEAKSLKDREDEIFLTALESNSEFKEAYLKNLLKSKGISSDGKSEKKQTIEEIVADEMTRDPAVRDQLVKAEIQKRLGKAGNAKPKTPLEEAKELHEYWETMRGMFGDKQQGTDWGKVLETFIKQGGIGELAETLGTVMAPDAAAQAAAQVNQPAQLMAPITQKLAVPSSQPITKEDNLSKSLIEYMPTMAKLVQTVEPTAAFELINAMKPEYCDMLYELSEEMVYALLEPAAQIPELKGKIDIFFSDKGHKWVKEFLSVNKSMIDAEMAMQNIQGTKASVTQSEEEPIYNLPESRMSSDEIKVHMPSAGK